MKTKVLFAAVAVAFSFAVTSCGNKKLLMPMLPEQTLVALHKQNRYVTLQRLAARLILPFVRKPVARKLIVRRPLAIAPSVTNLVKRSNSGLVSN